jgi:hypothetical protein
MKLVCRETHFFDAYGCWHSSVDVLVEFLSELGNINRESLRILVKFIGQVIKTSVDAIFLNWVESILDSRVGD